MSLLDRFAARHLAEKKAAQESKVKNKEDVEPKNLKLESVKFDLKQEDKMLSFEEHITRKLRCTAVLSISDSEDSDIPVLEEVSGHKEIKTKTLTNVGGTQGLKTIPLTMEEAMKDDTFRGATKMELEVLLKYGVTIPTSSDDKLCDSPRGDGEKDNGIIGSPKKQACLLDEKSVLLNTPQSDVTPDPKDNDIEPPKDLEEEEFITVTNRKG